MLKFFEMTEEQIKLFESLEDKIITISEKYKSLKKEKNDIEFKCIELERKLEDKENIYSTLYKQYNNLKIARELATTSGGRDAGKDRINQIVRDIDKCIALLNI